MSHGRRRKLSTAGIVALALALVGPALASAPGVVVLGKKHLLSGGVGWGSAHPAVIFNGGDPNGRASALRWSHWGSESTEAHGLTSIFRPDGGYFEKPGAIELRATRIGQCTPGGPRAYTKLQAREAVRPGGPFGQWFVWGGWKSICVGP